MRHGEKHTALLLSGYLWTSRIAMRIVAVFIVAMALNWSSVATAGAVSSHVELNSSSFEALNAHPDGMVEATHGVGKYPSCAGDGGTPANHCGTCNGGCSFMGCGGIITPALAIAVYPDFCARFLLAAIAAPHNLLFPPIARPPISPFNI